jgi:hypothetical protein
VFEFFAYRLPFSIVFCDHDKVYVVHLAFLSKLNMTGLKLQEASDDKKERREAN